MKTINKNNTHSHQILFCVSKLSQFFNGSEKNEMELRWPKTDYQAKEWPKA